MYYLKKINSNSYKYVYDFYFDDEKIGGFYIDEMDYITFFINDDKQENGYGNILFKYILDELKSIGLKKIYAEVSSDNIKARKIFSNNKIPDAGVYNDLYQYVIFIL